MLKRMCAFIAKIGTSFCDKSACETCYQLAYLDGYEVSIQRSNAHVQLVCTNRISILLQQNLASHLAQIDG